MSFTGQSPTQMYSFDWSLEVTTGKLHSHRNTVSQLIRLLIRLQVIVFTFLEVNTFGLLLWKSRKKKTTTIRVTVAFWHLHSIGCCRQRDNWYAINVIKVNVRSYSKTSYQSCSFYFSYLTNKAQGKKLHKSRKCHFWPKRLLQPTKMSK